MRKLKPKLLVLNPGGEIAGIADVRVVGRWPHIPGAPLPDDHDFSDDSVAQNGNPITHTFTQQLKNCRRACRQWSRRLGPLDQCEHDTRILL